MDLTAILGTGTFDLAVEVLGCYSISVTQPMFQSCTSNLNSRPVNEKYLPTVSRR